MNIEKARILVVDDDKTLLDVLSRVLGEMGEYQIMITTDPEEAAHFIKTMNICVVLTDIVMPGLGGLELLERVHAIDPKISVIMMTGYSDPIKMRRAIQLNAFDFLRKPFDFAEMQITIKQAVEKHHLLVQNESYSKHLETSVQQRTLELFDARGKLERSYLNTIYALVNAMEAKDIYTKGHSERVTILSLLLGKKLNMGIEDLKLLRIGALLHDIGKIGVFGSILNKDESLTSDEYDVIKQHPIIGDKIISPVGLGKPVHDIILQHHEWIDGSGYPYGIGSSEISYYSKIVSVADAFDAMTSQRIYRHDLSRESAFLEVINGSESQFDAHIAKCFYDGRADMNTEFEDKKVVSKLLFGQI